MEFDLLGELPRGVTVLEASAGTGKTYTIEGLVARYVAERFPLRRLLVVTFTRAATAELRDRVRTRMVKVAEHLAAVIDGASPKSDDEVADLLAGGRELVPLDVVRERHRKLAEALSDFDAATISTIHGFCQQVLAGVGLTGDMDRQATLIEDERDVVDAVVDDVLVERFAGQVGDVVVARRVLRAIAKALMDNPDAAIVPSSAEEPEVAVRVELARRVRDEVERRKRAFRLLSYNDLLVRLRDTLQDKERGAAARERLRGSYDVALIDEFQDTDPVQWEIFSSVFATDGSGGRSLVLIGDPKQAIYSFRGADVYAYLKASRGRESQSLQTNWRSDQGLLDAYNVVFSGAELGHDEIRYLPVSAAGGHEAPRLVDAPVSAPLRLRVARRDDGYRAGKGGIVAGAARAHVAKDVAVEAVRLLESKATIIDRGRDGIERGRRRVRPRDIAVLVRSNNEASLVQSELHDAGVPAVINGVGSVFATAAATEWLRLLEALEQPTSVTRARTATLTVFLGWSGERLADSRSDDRALDEVHEKLLAWAAILRDRSVASLLQTIVAHEHLPQRVLELPGGERNLTDVEHVAELLHAAQISEELGPSALTAWLRERIIEASDDIDADERARRLESDAEAVQVLTVHRSKGLEYPIVFAPFLWSSNDRAPVVPVFHDEERGGARSADVGGKESTGFGEHVNLHKDEAKGEELRLVYVALTRARHQAVVWWMPANWANKAPLSRLLLCRNSRNGDVLNAASLGWLKPDDLTRTDLETLADRTDAKMVVESIPFDLPSPSWTDEEQRADPLSAAPFDRTLDLRWRRTSYSAITRAVHDAPRVGSEPDVEFTDDEALAPAAVVEGTAPSTAVTEEEAALRAVALPLVGMPGGVDVGTFVHGIFEDTDFAAPDLRGHLGEVLEKWRVKRDVNIGDRDVFLDGMVRAIETPLGPLAGGRRLADLDASERLAELDFELPLVGGSADRSEQLAVAAIGRLMRSYLADDDPVRPYAERLFDRAFPRDLRGYLAGSIDAVLRVDGRYMVVDYKTNWLGEPDQELSAWQYRPAALVSAMERGHYPLQALLYAVALHRYLRWRVAGYSAQTHLGGVLYLFVRGMIGSDTPVVDGVPCGVFSWQPPAALIEALSDLIDEGEVAA